MRIKKLVLVLMVLLPCLILSMTAAEAFAKPRMVKVLIGFSQVIASADEKAMKNEGTIIRRKYNRIPVISAEVPERAIGLLRRLRGVSFVEKDGRVYTLAQTLPWGVDRVNADTVHSYNKGTGVKVGIIDTGIDLDHTDLAVAGDVTFVSGTTSGDDDHGHGTHVAGTVAALDNDYGVAGVAPEAELYAIKVLDSRGSGYWSDVVAGIEWAMDHGLQVINLSLGGTSGSTALETVCNVAYEAGVLIVAAAGNSGNTWGFGDRVIFPAKYDTVMAVAATDSSDERASFSSTGPDVEIAAPGVSIYSTNRSNTYTTKNGTSMASPHVAGVAALVIASGIDDTNGNMRINDEVRERLQQTADDLGDIGRDEWYGYGLVDADEAAPVPSNSPPTAPVVDVTPDSPTTDDDLVSTITTSSTDADGDVVTYSYAWYKDDALQGGLTGDTVTSADTLAGEVWRCVVTPDDGIINGPTGQDEVTIAQENSPPTAPVVDVTPDNPKTDDDLLSTITTPSTDADSDTVTYSYAWYKDDAFQGGLTGDTVGSANTSVGEVWRCVVTPNDGIINGPTGQDEVTIAPENSPPTAPVVDVTPDNPKTGDDLVSTITTLSTDADSDTVTYSYAWYKNDALQGGLTGGTVTSADTSAGEVWRCVVTPNDGTVDGSTGEDVVAIGNSPPTAPVVDVTPDNPKTGDDLVSTITTSSTDADGDVVTYSYAWYTDDALQGGLTGDTVTSAGTSVGEVWRCVVTPDDGTVDGPTGQDEVTIAPATEQTMRVVSIDMVLIQRYGGWRTKAKATVIVLDSSGDPVENATVNGHWENAVTDTELSTTGIDGEITFTSNYRRRPASGTIYNFVIDNVTKEGWNWTEEDSLVSGSVQVP